MKRIHIIGLCLMAITALSAVMAASAFASPEFSPASGGFTGKATNPTALKPTLKAGGTTVTCTNDTSEGEITGAMETGKTMVTFTGCKNGGLNCNTKISAAEEGLYGKEEAGKIVTKDLMGILGWANKTTTIVGLLLLPTTPNILAEFECTSSIKIVVTGNLIGEMTPFKTLSATFTLKFNEVGGKQELTTLELLGGVEDTASLLTEINGVKPGTASTQMSEDTLTLNGGKKGEII